MKKIAVVGGGGRVGLPLSLLLAKKGYEVRIIEKDFERIKSINLGKMPFHEPGASEILSALAGKKIWASYKNQDIYGCEVCILIIGTPVGDDGIPSAQFLIQLVQELVPFLNSIEILILRSTVFPGITSEIKKIVSAILPNVKVVFCPERIAQGNALNEISRLPQIIGADSNESFKAASEIFENITGQIIQTTYEEAELAKLFANTYRYVKFALANEFFELCVSNGINWENVWHALTFDYPRASDLPKPGFAAGPCLVKDTQQLMYFDTNFSHLGKSAIQINENLPNFIVNQLINKFELKKMVIGILGMTFKSDVNDFRSSLSFKLKKLLENVSFKVLCSDSILNHKDFIPLDQLLDESDLIVVASPHSIYSNLKTSKPIVDIWRVTDLESVI